MCGRYAMGIRAAFIRHQLQQEGMDVDEGPDDDATRETYNFAPGYYGLVYRADVPDYGAGGRPHDRSGRDVQDEEISEGQTADAATAGAPEEDEDLTATQGSADNDGKPQIYILQPMKWGLIPFWTKRSPDYGSMLRTINCRDDSLIENRGMWTTMKQRKRCIVICQGFYEWLKKGPSGKEKVPHFVKRKDGKMMCFAGLWDCVKYEGSEEKLYTYTVITTDSNAQLKFLHDRMPVILDQGSDAMRTWLDPKRSTWTKELQSLLKPYKGELECYPVSTDVGKVGNNSPNFIIPIDSKENKKNIANFFANAKKPKEEQQEIKAKDEDDRKTQDDASRTEDNAPVPLPSSSEAKKEYAETDADFKRRRDSKDDEEEHPVKAVKTEPESSQGNAASPVKPSVGSGKARSAISNATLAKGKASTAKKNKAADGSQRITNFFVR